MVICASRLTTMRTRMTASACSHRFCRKNEDRFIHIIKEVRKDKKKSCSNTLWMQNPKKGQENGKRSREKQLFCNNCKKSSIFAAKSENFSKHVG